MDVIYTDFTKAFDKVSHNILLHKMYNEFGLHSNLVYFFNSYLHNRKQGVIVRGYSSDQFIPKSGVPQGSNMGPLLFVLFIDSLIKEVKKCEVLMFADDLKLYASISNYKDCLNLQKNLNLIFEWSVENRLSFNITKCNVMSFTKKKKQFAFPIL